VKAGTDAEAVIGAAARYAAELRGKGQIGTRYVAQAVTWLNQQRWGDYPARLAIADEAPPGGIFVAIDTPQWEAWRAHLRSQGRVGAPQSDFTVDGLRARGWYFPSEWPPASLQPDATTH